MKYADFVKRSHSYIVIFHDDSEKFIKGEFFEHALESNGILITDIKEAYGITLLWSEK